MRKAIIFVSVVLIIGISTSLFFFFQNNQRNKNSDVGIKPNDIFEQEQTDKNHNKTSVPMRDIENAAKMSLATLGNAAKVLEASERGQINLKYQDNSAQIFGDAIVSIPQIDSANFMHSINNSSTKRMPPVMTDSNNPQTNNGGKKQ